MRTHIPFCIVVHFGFCLAAALSSSLSHPHTKPAAFFLTGDSTTAKITLFGGGWGDGFLQTLKNDAVGWNYGSDGATTVSFVEGGNWACVLAGVAGNRTRYTPYVTIQFGHNDQVASANISVPEYSANLRQMGLDVRAAGGHPIFVTSLSKRNWNQTSSTVIQDLSVRAAATISVAQNIQADYIDLNGASVAYLNAIGQIDSSLYNHLLIDSTHLNIAGQTVFGNMVSLLLGERRDGSMFEEWTTPNKTIASDIEQGIFVLPGGITF